MSFATCCPSCGTTFRVVRDQLKVSEGWVRCGRCGEVFCALDGLFELGRDEPAAQETARPEAPRPGPEAAAPAPQPASRQEPALTAGREPSPRQAAEAAPAVPAAPAAAAPFAPLEPEPGPALPGQPTAPGTIEPAPADPGTPATSWAPGPEPRLDEEGQAPEEAAPRRAEASAALAWPEPDLQPTASPQEPSPGSAQTPEAPLPEKRPADEILPASAPVGMTQEDAFATTPSAAAPSATPSAPQPAAWSDAATRHPADPDPAPLPDGDSGTALAAPPARDPAPPALPEDASLLRRTRRAADEDDGATSADVLDSRFFEDEERPELAWPQRPARAEEAEAEDFADARFSSTLEEAELAAGAEAPLEAAAPAVPAVPAAAVAASPVPLESEQIQPGFLQQAQRRERLSRPAVRATMGGLAAVLGLGLVLQVAHQQRERLAAEWPATRPVLQAWCGWTGCELGPLRRIEDVVLDHSALADAGNGRPGYRLNLLLRNRGDASVALPALELTLTDTRGRLVARRALLPSDFPQAPAAIAPRAQLALNIELDTPGQRLAGYTVETFYP